MTTEKNKVGDIRPIFQQIGWEVCKQISDKEDKEVWIPAEKQSDAEIMSGIFKQSIRSLED